MNPTTHARRKRARDARTRATLPDDALPRLWTLADRMSALWVARHGRGAHQIHPGHVAACAAYLAIGLWPTREAEQRRLACYLEALHEHDAPHAQEAEHRAHQLERAASTPPTGPPEGGLA